MRNWFTQFILYYYQQQLDQFMHTNLSLDKYNYNSKCYRIGIDNIKAYQGFVQNTGKLIYIKLIPLRNQLHTDSRLPSSGVSNQIQFLRNVRHGYFANLVELFETSNFMFLVTERQGTNLELQLHNIKGNKKIFQIFMNLVIGVCFMRSFGYLHTNFVASEIQIRQQNVKIGGFSACVNQFKHRNGIKMTNNIRNWQQLPPQLLRQQQFTEKSMIWNLGVILYKLIYKKIPFSSKNKHQQLIKVQFQRKILQDCQPAFKVLLAGCLKAKVEERFSLKQLLRCILTNQQIDKQFGHIIKSKLKILKQSYKLPQSQNAFQKQDKIKQIQDQINFILFLERICFMIQKAEIKISQPPMLSLTQYMIKCRIQKLKRNTYWKQKDHRNQLKYQLLQLEKAHRDKKYAEQQNILQKQQYRMYKSQDYRYKQMVYLKYQAQLREYIKYMINKIKTVQKRQIWAYRYSIHALNFIISVFQIGFDLVQEVQNHRWSSLPFNCLEQYSQNPLQYDINHIFTGILSKIKKLGFNINEQNLIE